MRLFLDFGTTNSVLVSSDNESPIFVKTLLFFFNKGEEVFFGNEAWEAFLDQDPPGRLIRSVKTFLAGMPVKTQIGRKAFDISDLVAVFLRGMKGEAKKFSGQVFDELVMGRPVVFRGQHNLADEETALRRLRDAAKKAGFKSTSFVFEPVAAALGVGTQLKGKVLVADLGGGTSDFSVVNFTGSGDPEVLAIGGLPIGGDVFDGDLLEAVLGDFFGRNAIVNDPLSSSNGMPFPRIFIQKLREWHLIPSFSAPQNLRELREIKGTCSDPAAVYRLIKVAEEEFGFELLAIVEEFKQRFANADESVLDLSFLGFDFRKIIKLSQFEDALKRRVSEIEAEVAATLEKANLKESDIDHVFLTGGSSRVRPIRQLFQEKFFGKVVISENFDDIAKGLARVVALV